MRPEAVLERDALCCDLVPDAYRDAMAEESEETHVSHTPDVRAGAERFLDMLSAAVVFDDDDDLANSALHLTLAGGIRATDLGDMVAGAALISLNLLRMAESEREGQTQLLTRLREGLERNLEQ